MDSRYTDLASHGHGCPLEATRACLRSMFSRRASGFCKAGLSGLQRNGRAECAPKANGYREHRHAVWHAAQRRITRADSAAQAFPSRRRRGSCVRLDRLENGPSGGFSLSRPSRLSRKGERVARGQVGQERLQKLGRLVKEPTECPGLRENTQPLLPRQQASRRRRSPEPP